MCLSRLRTGILLLPECFTHIRESGCQDSTPCPADQLGALGTLLHLLPAPRLHM